MLTRFEELEQCVLEIQSMLIKYQFFGIAGVIFDANNQKQIIPHVIRLHGDAGPGLEKLAMAYEQILRNTNTIGGFTVDCEDACKIS